ncbi:GNAT family N-acetyltransferase [Streptomyces sp. BI20]|uniref:GNAT family N-acetyltransferase n=1 Tax=Streptomyces sp. BI20 TaxID=3403460 RepID=UPI003C75DF7C
MTWTFTADPAVFAAAARPALLADPVAHTNLLSVLDACLRRGPHAYGDAEGPEPVFGWWTGDEGAGAGAVGGTVVRTPPFPFLCGTLAPGAATALPAALAVARPDLLDGSLNVSAADAPALAAGWGLPLREVERLRLHRLGTLVPPDPAPAGAARPAEARDLPLLRAWYARYAAAVGDPAPPAETVLAELVESGRQSLWERDGEPVAMACHSPVIAGTARVMNVYTPPEARRRGLAAAVTTAATRAARAAGAAEVLLWTDLANPTSNGVYRRLGYLPVTERVVLAPVPRP